MNNPHNKGVIFLIKGKHRRENLEDGLQGAENKERKCTTGRGEKSRTGREDQVNCHPLRF